MGLCSHRRSSKRYSLGDRGPHCSGHACAGPVTGSPTLPEAGQGIGVAEPGRGISVLEVLILSQPRKKGTWGPLAMEGRGEMTAGSFCSLTGSGDD